MRTKKQDTELLESIRRYQKNIPDREITGDGHKGKDIGPHDMGSYTIEPTKKTCQICRKCKKVVTFSDHCDDDTDEIELVICKDCMGIAVEKLSAIERNI